MAKQWKKVEKRHAELFGTIHTKTAFPAAFRLGAMHGRNYPDWIDDYIAGESKSGINLIPNWIRDAIDQAMRNEEAWSMDSDGQQRIPIVVLHTNKDLYDEDIVMIRSDIFREVILPALYARGKAVEMSWDRKRTK